MTISVFGNRDLENDGVLVRMIPYLQKKFPDILFTNQDPTENLTIPGDDWIILDSADGIKKVTVYNSIDPFITTRSLTTHDYDLSMELTLLKKTGQLPPVTIIAVPLAMKSVAARQQVVKAIGSIVTSRST